jgi:multidrug efflux pump subunit AcrA (membrane-fusion protein)
MPFHAARVLGLFVIGVFAIVTTGAIFVSLPETVEAPFVLLPEGGADPLESPFDGVIETVMASAGGSVKAGTVLFVVRAPEIQAMGAELRALEEERNGLILEQEASEAAYVINHDIQAAEIKQREKEVQYRREYLNVYSDVRRRTEALGQQGLASTVELLEYQLGNAEADRDVALAQERLGAAQLALKRIEAEHLQQQQHLESKLAQLEVRIDGLAVRLTDTSEDRVIVRAPYDGVIVSIARKRTGDVVQVGHELCQLAPLGCPLHARLQLEERGMARLNEGQPAKLLFHAFPYQRYGVIEGRIEWLSPAPVVAGEGRHFVARVTPDRLELGVGMYHRPLRAGMQGVARVQVGRRTLIEYAFEPLRKLRENLRQQEPGTAK